MGAAIMATELALTDQTPTDAPVEDAKWELAEQWNHFWACMKWGATAVLVLLALLIIGQGFLYYKVFADIHPVLGWVFVAALAGLLFLLVGRPLKAYLSTPVVATPPDVELDPEALSIEGLKKRLAYDIKFLKALARHPELKAENIAITASIDEVNAMLRDLKRGNADITDYAEKLAQFEAERIESLLTPLDAKVDRLIRTEATSIGVATAISMNGTVDAFIVLWRSANLVAKISRIYFGRPNFRGSMMILRDVAGIVVLSRALEDVTDITGDVIGSMLGRMGGLVAGPVMDGAINAMMALKLGYMTKRRCRSFKGWKPSQARSISANALARVQKESGAVVGELIKACGGLTASAAKATEHVMTGSRNVWSTIQSWFGGAQADASGAQ